MNSSSSIENKQSDRLGSMEGEGSDPDDYNKMGTDEIEDLFFVGQWELSRTLDVPTPYFCLNYAHIVQWFDKMHVIL